MIDMMPEIVDGVMSMRKDKGCMPSHAVVDLGRDGNCAMVPFDFAGAGLQKMLVALGAMCKRHGAPRVFVNLEMVGKVFENGREEADAFMEKYGGPRDVPLDDRDRFLLVSEIVFSDPRAARVAHIPVFLGGGVTFGLPKINQSHICAVYHAVFAGWASGQMPEGVELAEEMEDPDRPPGL